MTRDAHSKPDTLAGLLAEDHSTIDAQLRALYRSFDEGDAAEVFTRLDTIWARLAVHIRAENLQLFPEIIRLLEAERATGQERVEFRMGIREVIDRLRADHENFMIELRHAVKTIRALLDDQEGRSAPGVLQDVRRRVAALEVSLQRHNREEEESVYPMADEFLSSEERNDLVEHVRRELEALPPRIRRVVDQQSESDAARNRNPIGDR